MDSTDSSAGTFADRMAARSLAALQAKYPHALDLMNKAAEDASIELDPSVETQITIKDMIQFTAGPGNTVTVHLEHGVTSSINGHGEVVFTLDPVSRLPLLANVNTLVLRLVRANGPKPVHRLTGALNGILAAHPDARAYNDVDTESWRGIKVSSGPDAAVELREIIGGLFWMDELGVRRQVTINGAGIVSTPKRARMQPPAPLTGPVPEIAE